MKLGHQFRFIPDEDEKAETLIYAQHKTLGVLSRENISEDLKPVLDKCLRITGLFEGCGYSAISGNFDGQGMSLGILQWCLGQHSLQPLLLDYIASHTHDIKALWDLDKAEEFIRVVYSDWDTQMAWAKRFVGNREKPYGDWVYRLKILAGSEDFISIQQKYASGIFDKAVTQARSFNLTQENSVAMMFDICVQEGGVAEKHKAKIQEYLNNKHSEVSRDLTEEERLECIAKGRASFAIRRWQVDVLSRKLCIARLRSAPFTWNGEQHSGAVHGDRLDLARSHSLSTTKVLL